MQSSGKQNWKASVAEAIIFLRGGVSREDGVGKDPDGARTTTDDFFPPSKCQGWRRGRKMGALQSAFARPRLLLQPLEAQRGKVNLDYWVGRNTPCKAGGPRSARTGASSALQPG